MFGIDNPDTLLRPWESLKQFSEELYAALRRSQQVEQKRKAEEERKKSEEGEEDKITIKFRSLPDHAPPPPSMRARPLPEHDLAIQQAAKAPVTEPTRPQYPPPRSEAPPRPWPTAPGPSPPPTTKPAKPAPEAPRTPDTQPSPRRPVYAPSRPDPYKPPVTPPPTYTPTNFPYYPRGGGAGSYMGQVLSFQGAGDGVNSGSNVIVQLYSDGPNGPPDRDGPNGEKNGQITVGIPMFEGSDSIPPGYWMTGITASSDGTTYWAQVPIWS